MSAEQSYKYLRGSIWSSNPYNPAAKSGREKFGLALGLEVIENKARLKRVKDGNMSPQDDIYDLLEVKKLIDGVVGLVESAVEDDVALTENEALALCECGGFARQLTIALSHAVREISSGPLDRHREHKRQQKCLTTSTSAGSDPEYR